MCKMFKRLGNKMSWNPLLSVVYAVQDITGLPLTFALLATILFFTWVNLKIVRYTARMFDV